jgi:hypothetical protein
MNEYASSDFLIYAVTEKELKSNVESAMKQFGWKYYHTFFSQYSDKGFPDLVAARSERTIWIELKTMSGKVTTTQNEWLETLADNPHNEVFLIRPNQMELVIEILTRTSPYLGPERWKCKSKKQVR